MVRKSTKKLGEKLLKAFKDCFNAIDINPKTFAKKHKEQRQAIVKKFLYVVMYEIVKKDIIVYAVFNTHQNPEKIYSLL